jgi:uncharacterized protein YprB with RNaseH-like and TPR domain
MNIYLDIETIPAGEPIDPMTLTPPATMSKPETIAAWYKDKAVDMAAEKYRSRSLDSMQGQILCIGCAFNDEPVSVIMAGDELETLTQFQTFVNSIMGRWDEPVNFVGWNIRTFDVPYIWRKAIKYQLDYLKKAFNRDRGRGNIIDLMEVWGTDFRDMRKQGDVALFLGLQHDDTVKGSQVYDLYLQDRLGEIADHCKSDVETVREIHRRIYA